MMNRRLITLATCLLLTAPAWSQPSGSGPAPRGGYGGGPGMMGGGGYGMGGYGYGMGPGMMGHYGMGPGMMGEYGMGPGMMWGYGPGIPDLTSEQRKKIGEIQKDQRQKQWQLMEKMHEQNFQSGGAYRDGKFDEQAARKRYDEMAALRKQMFENSLQERKRIDDVLTPQQRQQLQRPWGGTTEK